MIYIALLVLIVFARTLKYDMVIDDNCRKFHVKDLHKNIIIRIYRLTRYSGYGGIPLWADHLLTIAIHIAVCIAIYIAFGSNIISLIASVLFAVNPANNQVSIWLNGKRFGVTTLLVLLMWAFVPYGIIFYLLTPIWSYAGVPAILLYALTPYKWLLLGIPLLLLLFHKRLLNKIATRLESLPPGEIKIMRPMKIVIAIKMYGYIALHCLLPRRMSFYHMFMERFGFSNEDNKYWYSLNKDFWIGIAVLSTIIATIVYNWGNPTAFGLVWFTLMLLPWLQFPIGMTQAIAERDYYLPMVGLMLAMSNLLLHMPYGELAIVAYATYLLTRLWFYMPAYKDLDIFYRYALHEFPEHFRARSHVIRKDLQDNKLFYCLHNCGVGVRYHPKDCTMNLLMCQSLMALGAFPKALEYLGIAKANMIPGQEKPLTEVIDMFHQICTDTMAGKPMPEHIQPGEIVNIAPSQIMGG